MIVAERYANSIMLLAREKGKVEDVRNDMQLILDVEKQTREFGLMLKSPVIKQDKKIEVLESIFKGKLSDITMAFVNLITTKHRESILVDIARAFNEQYKRDKNIFTAVVTSAHG